MKTRNVACCLLLSLVGMPLGFAQDETEIGASTPEGGAVEAPEEAATPEEATPPADVTSPADSGPSETGPSDKPEHGLLGPLRVGPTFAVGVPHPMNYGLDALYDRTWGFAFGTGKITLPMGKVEAQMANWDLRVRWHPGQGSFFWGLAYGQQKILVEAQEDLKFKAQGLDLKVPTTLQLEVENSYVTPHMGWFAMWDSGFTLGFEFGVQVPMSSKAELNVGFENVTPSQEDAIKKEKKYTDLETKVEDAGKLLGKTALPYLTLIRLGWMF